MRPLEITRRSIANWSDSEMTALGIAVKQAGEECSSRSVDQFNGDDLIAFARLCSLGQQWPEVEAAATRYIASTDPAKPLLTQAYAFQVAATLHGSDQKAVLASSLAMLHAVPYSSLTDETLYGALHYLQLAYTLDAFTLYLAREPLLLSALRTPQPISPAAGTDTAVPIHTLYADGVAFAALEQLMDEPGGATGVLDDLDAALPTALQPDDSIPIASTRRQYALLGTHLPRIPLSASLYAAGETPRINTNYGAATVFFLFPDWCAQCIRMAQQLLPTADRLRESQIHLYALLAQPAQPIAAVPKSTTTTKPSSPAAKQSPEPEAPKTAVDQLRGTPTLIVPPQTLAQFAATDFPLLIAIDPKGIIRFIQPANESALNPGDFLDQVTAHIVQQWPRQASATASPAAAKP
jgi:hypothetical protein